jgi:hypothetical protein
MPGRYDIQLRQGDTYDETYTVVDTLLTGYTALMQIRDSAGEVKVTCSSADGTLLIDVQMFIVAPSETLNTVLTPVITAAQTAALNSGVYYYDLQVTAPNGAVKTLLAGTVTVDADITRLP